MNPAHLISAPRAHPSGTGKIGMEEHHQLHHQNITNETWFMILTGILILVFSLMAALITTIFFRRKNQIKKEIGHLSGNSNIDFA